jgi:hypothetical protein
MTFNCHETCSSVNQLHVHFEMSVRGDHMRPERTPVRSTSAIGLHGVDDATRLDPTRIDATRRDMIRLTQCRFDEQIRSGASRATNSDCCFFALTCMNNIRSRVVKTSETMIIQSIAVKKPLLPETLTVRRVKRRDWPREDDLANRLSCH